jgi:hypothetical protein
VLYALPNSPGTSTPLQVGFVSAGQPGTLTEADYTAGKWQLAPLPKLEGCQMVLAGGENGFADSCADLNTKMFCYFES